MREMHTTATRKKISTGGSAQRPERACTMRVFRRIGIGVLFGLWD